MISGKFLNFIKKRNCSTRFGCVVWYSWFHIKGTWSVHSFNGITSNFYFYHFSIKWILPCGGFTFKDKRITALKPKKKLHQRGKRLKQKLLEMVQVTVPIFILMKSEKTLILRKFTNNVKCIFLALPPFSDFIKIRKNWNNNLTHFQQLLFRTPENGKELLTALWQNKNTIRIQLS